MLRKLCLVLAAVVIFGVLTFGDTKGVHAASAELVAAAKKEGKVVWYTSLIVNQIVRPIAKGFTDKYGIEVEFVSALWQEQALRIVNEGRTGQPRADIFDGPPTFTQVYAAGFIQPYRPESAANYLDLYKDPNGLWTAHSVQPNSAAVNTDLVKEADYPKTWEDLLDPKWKDRMAWTTSTSTGGPVGMIGTILNTMGEEKGMAFLKKLSQQRVKNIPSNQRVVLDKAIAGEYPLVLSIYNYHVPISAAKGAPVKWLKIEPLSGHYGLVALIKNSPHPNAGKLLLDYILSEEGQKIHAEAGYIPAHPNVLPADAALKPDGNYKFFGLTPQMEEKDGAKWLKIYEELFQ